jgi:hypothetical protein
VKTPDRSLTELYAERIRLLVLKSPLSHAHIAAVLEDMLKSDLVILWELMGNPTQSGPYEELLAEFMTDVQRDYDADPRARAAVRLAIKGQLAKVEGSLHLQ